MVTFADQSTRAAQHVGVRDLRAALAAHLARVESGQTLIVNRGGRPVARLGPIDADPVGQPDLEDMARLGVIDRPRLGPENAVEAVEEPSRSQQLPVDIRVDRIVRLVRG